MSVQQSICVYFFSWTWRICIHLSISWRTK